MKPEPVHSFLKPASFPHSLSWVVLIHEVTLPLIKRSTSTVSSFSMSRWAILIVRHYERLRWDVTFPSR